MKLALILYLLLHVSEGLPEMMRIPLFYIEDLVRATHGRHSEGLSRWGSKVYK
jgi:hypothetical protein